MRTLEPYHRDKYMKASTKVKVLTQLFSLKTKTQLLKDVHGGEHVRTKP